MDVTEKEHLTEELRRREAHLAEAQRLSHTGSFGWRVSTGEILFSEETFQIFQFDRTTTLELALQRVHPEDGGRLWAADNAPRGASFSLTLPSYAA
jgi:C4-dicarboxylate-specific signal transduction histidine kinase